MLQTFLRDLQQPEYIHVLINPLPVYGLAIGLIGLVVALCLRSRRAQITALVLIFIAAASAWPVVHFGEEAYDRVLSMTDSDGEAWLKAHEQRADKIRICFLRACSARRSGNFPPKEMAGCCDAARRCNAHPRASLVRRWWIHCLRRRQDSSSRISHGASTTNEAAGKSLNVNWRDGLCPVPLFLGRHRGRPSMRFLFCRCDCANYIERLWLTKTSSRQQAKKFREPKR